MVDLGHGRGWLLAPAAASVRRIDKVLGRPLSVNSAGRTLAEQWHFWNLYVSGKGNLAAYPGTSVHERGLAIDTNDSTWLRNRAGFGWVNTGLGFKQREPWHFEYNENLDVALVQELLNLRGYSLVVDGIRGVGTVAAIKDFQTKNNLVVDGINGVNTLRALRTNVNTPAAPVTPPSKPAPTPSKPVTGKVLFNGWKVAGIQAMLKGTGRYKGAVDNIFGVGSVKALQAFLKAGGYYDGAIDGIAGIGTYKAIQRWLKARWGYKGAIDGLIGAGSREAWLRADTENWAAYKRFA